MESATWISKYLSANREPWQFDFVGHQCLLSLVQTIDVPFLFLPLPRGEAAVQRSGWARSCEKGESGGRQSWQPRHNKYNGWTSIWRESPGDFAGFCNWNAFRGGTEATNTTDKRRFPSLLPSLYFASRVAVESQLNGMSSYFGSLSLLSLSFAVPTCTLSLLSRLPVLFPSAPFSSRCSFFDSALDPTRGVFVSLSPLFRCLLFMCWQREPWCRDSKRVLLKFVHQPRCFSSASLTVDFHELLLTVVQYSEGGLVQKGRLANLVSRAGSLITIVRSESFRNGGSFERSFWVSIELGCRFLFPPF